MSSPTPVQSFLGGIGIVVPIQFLLTLNGSVFGISGFLHSAVQGGLEPLTSVAGLLVGGIIIGAVERTGPQTISAGLLQIAFSGLLVGIGSKLSAGCTSGHMICGVSRLSPRSIVATATFFVTAVVTTRLAYKDTLPPIRSTDWTLGPNGNTLLKLQAFPWAISTLLCFFNSPASSSSAEDREEQTKSYSFLRPLTCLTTAFNFAIALHLSNLSDPNRVTSFLLLPFDRAFDPSLAYLAIGALPIGILLYHFGRGKEYPRLGGHWAVPKSGKINLALVFGAATFGVGWGLGGICPGPGLVNLGRALVSGSGIRETATWVGSVVLGGLLV